jgi:hypothetical protein
MDNLPVELIHKIYNELDFWSVRNLSLANKYMRDCVPRGIIDIYKKRIECNKLIKTDYGIGCVNIGTVGVNVTGDYILQAPVSDTLLPQTRYNARYSIRNNIMYIYRSCRYNSVKTNSYELFDYLFVINDTRRGGSCHFILYSDWFGNCMSIMNKPRDELYLSQYGYYRGGYANSSKGIVILASFI